MEFTKNLAKTLGTADGDLTQHRLFQLFNIFPDSGEAGNTLNVALASLHSISPKDSVESMLGLQMLGTHNLAMEFIKRALMPNQTFDGVNENVNRAAKLMKAFAAQVEALSRYRGKGRQSVVVKHMHVSEGGQAIVGNVNGPSGRGEGGK